MDQEWGLLEENLAYRPVSCGRLQFARVSMSANEARAENICSLRVFPALTLNGRLRALHTKPMAFKELCLLAHLGNVGLKRP